MIKKLSKCIGEHKKDAILSPVFVGCETFLEVLIPFLMSKLIDKGINAGNLGEIVKYGAILIVFALCSLTFGILAGSYAAKASTGFAKNIRKRMFYNVQNFSFRNIDKFSTASIVTRLTTDVTHLQNAFLMIIRTAVRCPAMLIFSLAMTMYISGKMSLIFLVLLPFMAVALFLISSSAHPIFKKMFKTYDKLNRIVQENLRGIRVVKSYVREDHEADKFKEVSGEIYDHSTGAEKILSFNGPVMQFATYTAIIAIAWFGAKMIVVGNLTEGQLVSLLSYVMQVLMSLMMLSMVFVMLVMSRASAERITEILDEESDIKNPEEAASELNSGKIEFKNVFFGYSDNKDRYCLKDINLTIESGETVGIIGGTGSSKSTLVQLIPRLYDTREGEVLVDGRNVREYDLEVLRDSVAMVLQKNELFSGTIKDNLCWGNKDATEEEIIKACRLAQADSFIQSFPEKYETKIEQGGTNVSGGQKQRLCIARALLKKPKILILDDSTSAVDTRTDAEIRRAFREEIPHITKLIIAQRISSVQDADKIIVMDNGRIDAVGTHDQLLESNEIYREVYNSQVKGGEE